MPTPWMTRKPMSMPIVCDRPLRAEPTTKTTMAACTSIFLLNRSASLPQMGVVAVAARRDAVTTQVYCDWVPSSSEVIVGSALETIVELSRPTNRASSRPLSASSVSRLVIGAAAAAAAAGGPARWVVLMWWSFGGGAAWGQTGAVRRVCGGRCAGAPGEGGSGGGGRGPGRGEAVAQPGEAGQQRLGGPGLPVVDHRRQQAQPLVPPLGQALGAAVGQREQAGAPVPRVRAAGHQPVLLGDGDGAADHRGVHAEISRQSAQPQLTVVAEQAQDRDDG